MCKLTTRSEFNFYRNPAGDCVLVEGATALSATSAEAEQCNGYESFWYERTAYRKIPYSSCEGGNRPDRGKQHACPGLIGGGGHGFFFWAFILLLPFGCAGAAAWYFYQQMGRPGCVFDIIYRN